jgi:putative colanic acid biosynthesis glycosyltransferase WcaI
MRMLIIGINYHPELTGIGKYTGEMAQWLAAEGHEVRMITAPPYYPAWRVEEGYSPLAYRNENVDGVRVLRCPLWVPRRPGGLKRILHLLSFAISSAIPAFWLGLRWCPDVVLGIEPPLFSAPVVLAAAKLGGSSAWLHIQDFEVDAAFDLGLLRSPRLRALAAGMERWLLRRFDRVSTISERMLDRLADKGVAPANRLLFPNWVDTGLIRPISDISRLRAEFDIPAGRIVLLYSGNMGRKQGLELIIEVAKLLSDSPDYLFLLCGDGAAREELEAQSGTLPNVRFLTLQPLERFNELLNLADIHLLPQRADAEDLVMPSKLTAMLASGRPVIATARVGSQVAEVVGGCGQVVMPGDRQAFLAAVQRLGRSPEERQRLGLAGRTFAVEHWSKYRVLSRMIDEISVSHC